MNLPPIGFGCSPLRSGGRRVDLEPAVREALITGYRLFDVAELYGNESAVGRAFRSLDAAARKELFVVGKLWRTNYRPEHVRPACEASLERIGLDAFDLYLLHAPDAWKHVAPLDDAEQIGWDELERRALPRDGSGAPIIDAVSAKETWEAMRELVTAGLVRGIGASNFAPEEIMHLGSPLPVANEIGCASWRSTVAMRDWCRGRGIALLGHSPLSSPPFERELLASMARSLGRTPEQLVLRYLIQSGITPLPSSTRQSHIRQNFAALDFALSREETQQLESALLDGTLQ